MSRRGIVGVFLALALVVGAGTQADAARRSSLAGNILIEDVKDVFFFPHEIVQYVNHVWFDFVTGQGLNFAGLTDAQGNPMALGAGDPHLGSGGILIGNAVSRNFGIGIATHRADFQGALWEFGRLGVLGNAMQLLANTGYENAQGAWSGYGVANNGIGNGNPALALDALNWIDLLVGFAAGPGLDIGARLSIAYDINSVEALEGNNGGSPNPGASASTVNILASVGYGDSDAPFYLDGALELTLGSWAAEGLIPPDQGWTDEGSVFGLGLMGRGFMNMSESIALGVMAELDYRSRNTNLDDPAEVRFEMDVSEMFLEVAAGPRYRIADEATVSAYGIIGLMQTTIDPEGRRNVIDDLTFFLPGINIAAEWQLTDWFAYRAGLTTYYVLHSREEQREVTDVDDTGGFGFSDNNLFFYWSNGVGINALEGDFTLDAMLNWPVITAGPNILSGQIQDTFAMVTVGYTF